MNIKAVLLSLIFAACSTLTGLTKMDDFSDAEFDRYVARTSSNVALLASAAIEEGDLSRARIGKIADALRVVAEDGAGLTGLLAGIGADGYAQVALILTLNELEARLEARGAYSEDGLLGPRAKALILSVAEALSSLGLSEGEGE